MSVPGVPCSFQSLLAANTSAIHDAMFQHLRVHHVPTLEEDQLEKVLAILDRELLPIQKSVTIAIWKTYRWQTDPLRVLEDGWDKIDSVAQHVLGECGTGKTTVGLAVFFLLYMSGDLSRGMAILPPHLPVKWVDEVAIVLGDRVVVVDLSTRPLQRLMAIHNGIMAYKRRTSLKADRDVRYAERFPGRGMIRVDPGKMFLCVIKETSLKGHCAWKPAVKKRLRFYTSIDKDGRLVRRGVRRLTCPSCFDEIESTKDHKHRDVMDYSYTNGHILHKYSCIHCGSPLWQNVLPSNYKAFEKFPVKEWFADDWAFRKFREECRAAYHRKALASMTILLQDSDGDERDIKCLFRLHQNLADHLSFQWYLRRLRRGRIGRESAVYEIAMFVRKYFPKMWFDLVLCDEEHKFGSRLATGRHTAWERFCHICGLS